MITDPEVLLSIKKHHLISSLLSDQLKLLSDCATRTQLNLREILFSQGEEAERFYFVYKGIIRLFRTSPTGNEKVVDIVRQGQCFAGAIMFSEQSTFPISADAQTQSEIIGIDSNVFIRILNSDNSISLKLLQQMCIRLHRQLNEIENLSLQNATHRLMNFFTA